MVYDYGFQMIMQENAFKNFAVIDGWAPSMHGAVMQFQDYLAR
jgi:hypothetical protein